MCLQDNICEYSHNIFNIINSIKWNGKWDNIEPELGEYQTILIFKFEAILSEIMKQKQFD